MLELIIFGLIIASIVFFVLMQLFYDSKTAEDDYSKERVSWNFFLSIPFVLICGVIVYSAAVPQHSGVPDGPVFLEIESAISKIVGIFSYIVFFFIFQIKFLFLKNKNLKWDIVALTISILIFLIGVGMGIYSEYQITQSSAF
ncbi:MAG: hypothetical protein WC823_03910 [Parcubacteria group bacterium]|jgi:hypothetical protein